LLRDNDPEQSEATPSGQGTSNQWDDLQLPDTGAGF